MAVHLSPKTQALINDRMATSDYPDADAMIEQALVLLEERDRILTLSDLAPEQRDQLWQEFLLQVGSSEQTMIGP